MSNNGTQAATREPATVTRDADMGSIIDAAIERSEARWRAAEAARQPKLTLGDTLQLAQVINGSPTLPDHIKKPGDIVAIVLRGQELGLPPMASLQLISLVKGRTVIDATAMRGLLLKRGFRLRWGVCDEKGASLWIKRPESGTVEQEYTYTFEQAKAAKLTEKDNWKNYLADMLVARVSTRACRRAAGDVVAGCYSPEELADNDFDDAPDRRAATAVVTVRTPSKTPTVYVMADEVAGLATADDVRTWWACHGHEVTSLASSDAQQVKLAVKAACKRTGLDPKTLAAGNGNGATKPAETKPEPIVEHDADGVVSDADDSAAA